MEKLNLSSVYGTVGIDPYIEQVQNFDRKMEMYRKNDMALLRDTLQSVLNATTDKKSAEYRYNHCKMVAALSEDLAFEITRERTSTNSTDFIIVKTIEYLNDFWIFSMLGFIHDMYKYAETAKVNHGKIASKQFSLYCKIADVEMSGIVLQMKEALLFHSNKDMTIIPNPFFSILCDADVLSHITTDTIEQYMRKANLTEDQAFKKIITLLLNYVPKSSVNGFNKIKDDLLNKLSVNMQIKRWLD